MKYAELKNYDDVYNAMVLLVNRTAFGVPLAVFTAAVGDVLKEKLEVDAKFWLSESSVEILPTRPKEKK